RGPIETGAVTFGTRHVKVGQEVHLDLAHALPLALFAAAALDVEAEPARLIAAQAGLARGGVDLADFVEQPGVGRRIAARSAADRRLVDLDELVDLAHAAQAGVRAGFRAGGAQPPGHRAGQRLLDQRTLARSADPRHADQCAQRKRNAQLLEIVGRGALDGDRLALARAAALGGRGDR